MRAEILLESARSEAAGYRGEAALARQTLAALLGMPNLDGFRLAGELAEDPGPYSRDTGPERWLAAHPLSMAARAEVDRANLEWGRARLAPYPDVTLSVAGGEASARGGSIVQFGLSVPLPILDRSRGKQREARANVAVAEAEAAATGQRLRRAWAAASQRLQAAAAKTANSRERILPKAGEALRLVRVGFQEGKFGLIDLLDTQRTLAEARLSYQRQLLELNTAVAEIEALAGGPPEASGGLESKSQKPLSSPLNP